MSDDGDLKRMLETASSQKWGCVQVYDDAGQWPSDAQ